MLVCGLRISDHWPNWDLTSIECNTINTNSSSAHNDALSTYRRNYYAIFHN